MRKEVDARGQLCPKPVIMTKKELDNLPKGIVTTIVDNEVAKDNVSKLAASYGYSFIIDKGKEDNEYYIHITKGGVGEEIDSNICIPDTFKDVTIAIGSDKMGAGEEKLGKILIKSFIYTVKETTPLPATMVFFNSGVYLTCEGSEVLEDLKVLANEGVEMISCGTCLDYYNIKDKLQVGEIGNMYSIYEKMRNANNTINIG
ncbi:sulfurtransferase-like selenium metabolism protein YedF [Tissierella praeacuta]|uniref:sulfurtransferase-like selenium metabolism protein YedF n=1 Tax=Tissierella praeacuta TaxID=43131 RepID=UPI003342151D